jgi:hypothetical protein
MAFVPYGRQISVGARDAPISLEIAITISATAAAKTAVAAVPAVPAVPATARFRSDVAGVATGATPASAAAPTATCAKPAVAPATTVSACAPWTTVLATLDSPHGGPFAAPSPGSAISTAATAGAVFTVQSGSAVFAGGTATAGKIVTVLSGKPVASSKGPNCPKTSAASTLPRFEAPRAHSPAAASSLRATGFKNHKVCAATAFGGTVFNVDIDCD